MSTTFTLGLALAIAAFIRFWRLGNGDPAAVIRAFVPLAVVSAIPAWRWRHGRSELSAGRAIILTFPEGS